MVACSSKILGAAKCLVIVNCMSIAWVVQTFSSLLWATKTLETSLASPDLTHTSKQLKCVGFPRKEIIFKLLVQLQRIMEGYTFKNITNMIHTNQFITVCVPLSSSGIRTAPLCVHLLIGKESSPRTFIHGTFRQSLVVEKAFAGPESGRNLSTHVYLSKNSCYTGIIHYSPFESPIKDADTVSRGFGDQR